MEITNKNTYDLICNISNHLTLFQCLMDEHIEMGKRLAIKINYENNTKEIVEHEVNTVFLKKQSNEITKEIRFLSDLIGEYDNRFYCKGE